jgi:redox-sensitive bicupin YhaK (pirin superfamily)
MKISFSTQGQRAVAQGLFVMNTMSEIAQAFEDLYSGKYGTIDYARSK